VSLKIQHQLRHDFLDMLPLNRIAAVALRHQTGTTNRFNNKQSRIFGNRLSTVVDHCTKNIRFAITIDLNSIWVLTWLQHTFDIVMCFALIRHLRSNTSDQSLKTKVNEHFFSFQIESHVIYRCKCWQIRRVVHSTLRQKQQQEDAFGDCGDVLVESMGVGLYQQSRSNCAID
jgi:hypothetical protein